MSLDTEQKGTCSFENIKNSFIASRHPDVESNKKSEEDILLDFLDTFETHHNILYAGPSERMVTFAEFEEYYSYYNLAIEDDEIFIIILKRVWGIEELPPKNAEVVKENPQEEVAIKPEPLPEEEKSSHYSPPSEIHEKPSPPPIENPIATKSPEKKRAITNKSSVENPLDLGAKLYNQMITAKKAKNQDFSADVIIDRIRRKLSNRGPRGIIGLAKQLKVAILFFNKFR